MQATAFENLPIANTPARGMVTFQVEQNPVAVIRSEGMSLLNAHWREVAQYPEVQVLDPDWQIYEQMERSGKLWVLTARDGGRLVGYIVMMLSRHLHYRSLTIAIDDIHFIHPDYRKGLTGYRMIRTTVKAMQALGVRMCTFRTKAAKDHGQLFRRLGFEPNDIVYAKILER